MPGLPVITKGQFAYLLLLSKFECRIYIIIEYRISLSNIEFQMSQLCVDGAIFDNTSRVDADLLLEMD